MLVKKDKRDACPTIYNQPLLYEMSELMSELHVTILKFYKFFSKNNRKSATIKVKLTFKPIYGGFSV